MGKIFTGSLLGLLSFLIIFSFTFGAVSPVLADDFPATCGGSFNNWATSANYPKQANLEETFDIRVNFTGSADSTYNNYYVKLTHFGTQIPGADWVNKDVRSSESNTSSPVFHIAANGAGSNETQPGNFRVTLMHGSNTGFGSQEEVCELGNIIFVDKNLNAATCNIKMSNEVKQNTAFNFNIEKNDIPGIKYQLYFFKSSYLNPSKLPTGVVEIGRTPSGFVIGGAIFALSNFQLSLAFTALSNQERASFLLDNPAYAYLTSSPPNNTYSVIQVPNNTYSGSSGNLGWAQMTYGNSGSDRLEGGDYVAIVEVQRSTGPDTKLVSYCSKHDFKVINNPSVDPNDPNNWSSGTSVTQPGQGGTVVGGTTGTRAPITPAAAGGDPCNDSRGPGFKTAIGCIHTNPAELVKDFMTFLVGISGGFAFLMMLLGAFQMLTSAGNPETLATGKDRFTSAIIGLLFVIFAVLLLQIIGFDILRLPGFNR